MAFAIICTTVIPHEAYAQTAQTVISTSGSYMIRNHMAPVNYVKNIVRNDQTKIVVGSMRMSDKGLAIIRNAEGFRATPYNHDGRLSIGYGHTKNVKFGNCITKIQAEHLLCLDVAYAEEAVNRLIKVPLNQGQFDALVSLTFNIGEGGLIKSHIPDLINRSDFVAAGNVLLSYDHVHGKFSRGLDIRRKKEYALYMSVDRPTVTIVAATINNKT